VIRRRCHLIVVSDAGCDPNAGLWDLGNAVRRVSIDMNVRIEFKTLSIEARKNPPVPGADVAVAHITYPEKMPSRGCCSI
jgi:hypothetical protein